MLPVNRLGNNHLAINRESTFVIMSGPQFSGSQFLLCLDSLDDHEANLLMWGMRHIRLSTTAVLPLKLFPRMATLKRNSGRSGGSGVG
ncbi:unnamed protein product [Protopolystoma xenopodis]|uniref:Uncharacterized protein n=1 Tax=Protopolystoma xenopodis TaxID=117903 RepID=A0A448X2V4_9PLAT|nr:unnamed protein product [Protopolystoma xenopodis]